MSNMIERVARAMAAEGLKTAEPQHMTRERFIDGLWEQFVPQARAAIAAMREPTEAIIQAALDDDLDIYWSYRADSRRGGPEDVFRTMIDAAMNETATSREHAEERI